MAECKQCGCYRDILVDDLCASCTAENEFAQEAIVNLQEEGHPHHCACRQVWGDGECECGLYPYGYDPYAWMKKPAT